MPWNQSRSEEKTPDRWSKTYIHRERSASPTRIVTTQLTGSIPSASLPPPTKRFPRPASDTNVSAPVLGSRVSAHIASATSQNRPLSPCKYPSTLPDPDSDILPSLTHHDATLSKVYGSVLQPKESLTTHSCAICLSTFPPDATIYPDPTVADASRFLCRSCFTINGGSKGPCGGCSRPVLILKAEGEFIEAAEKFWHKRCFNCSGCLKNIGHSPMVDLFGNPSCTECFDNCLKRGLNISESHSPSNSRANKVSNIGGMNFNSNGYKSSEGSPAVDELKQRLGIAKSREGSPALEELSQRLSMIGKESAARYSAPGSPIGRPLVGSPSRVNSPLVERSRIKRNSHLDESPARRDSPVGGQTIGSPPPSQEAIEEMKQRFLQGSPYSSTARTPTSDYHPDPPSITRLYSRPSTPCGPKSGFSHPSSLCDKLPASPFSPIIPQTPDLMSDFSDTMTQSSSSGPGSPPRDDEDFNELLHSTGLELPHDTFQPLGRLVEEGTSIKVKSPIHTPKRFKSYDHASSPPSKASTSASDSSRYPPVKPKSSQSCIIPPSNTAELTASARCADCGGNLFSVREGGKFVTVPNDDGDTQALTYHIGCFKCVECHGTFKEANTGKALFVKSKNGPCHAQVRLLKFPIVTKDYNCVS